MSAKEKPPEPRYAVTFGVSKRVIDACARIAERLEEHGIRPRSMPPHITIKAPFVMPKRTRGAESVLDTIAARGVLHSVHAEFGPLSVFTHKRHKTLYVPILSETLHAMARYVIGEFVAVGAPAAEHEGKILHLSLARSVPERTFADIWHTLERVTLPSGTLLVKRMILYEKANGLTREVARYTLPEVQ